MNIHKFIVHTNEGIVTTLKAIIILFVSLFFLSFCGFILYWGYGGEYCPKILSNLYREEMKELYIVSAISITAVFVIQVWIALIRYSKRKLEEMRDK